MSLVQINNVAWLQEQAKDPMFWEFLSAHFGEIVQSEQQAINVVCWHVHADALTDLDERASVASQFHEACRRPYVNSQQLVRN